MAFAYPICDRVEERVLRKNLRCTWSTVSAATNLMASLALTPRGHLLLSLADDEVGLTSGLARRLKSAFERGSGHGLLELGAAEAGTVLPADLGYWRDFAARLVTAICTHPDLASP